MTVTMARPDFRPRHAVADLGILYNIFALDRFSETRPARMAVKFIDRSEQWFARHHVHINARLFVVPIGVVKGALSPISLSNAVLLGREARYSVGIFVVCRHMFSFSSEESDRDVRSEILRHTSQWICPIWTALPTACISSRVSLTG